MTNQRRNRIIYDLYESPIITDNCKNYIVPQQRIINLPFTANLLLRKWKPVQYLISRSIIRNSILLIVIFFFYLEIK